ncbi:uncharacterized protein TNCV_2756181 [Trichonephila clavipes]|nr:uncharacterized protein TNCV_2756181 [Trichonephila clavipes]
MTHETNETTGKITAELFLGRKLITPFQKLVMVSDGKEFAVGDIEILFEEARRNTKTKHEKWEKYYNRRRRDVQIKVNDWVLIATHPLSSATRKVVAKFKAKFEGPYRVLNVKNNNVVIWKAGKRFTINADQFRIYRHRKCDETEIGTGSSDKGSLRDESSGFDRVQRRSNESQDEYRNCDLSYRNIAARFIRDPMTVSRLWNRWLQNGNMERRAGSQWSTITNCREDRSGLNGSCNLVTNTESRIGVVFKTTSVCSISSTTFAAAWTLSSKTLAVATLDDDHRQERLQWCDQRRTWGHE